MERLTRPTVKVDETAAQYMVAQGCIPTDLRSMNDRLLDLVINGPTLNGVNKDVLRQLIRQLYAALMPYEDTGLEPEKIHALQIHPDHAYADYVKQLFPIMERLEELAEADKAGRLLVLPCKVGDTVYRLITPKDAPAVICEKPIRTVGEAANLVGWLGKKRLLISVFASREEAERALEGGQKEECVPQ